MIRPFPGAAVYAENHPLPRQSMLVVALAPAVLLTLVFVVLLTVPELSTVAIWGAALNLGGAVLDFAMAAWLLCLPRDSWVEDLRDGLRVLPRGSVMKMPEGGSASWFTTVEKEALPAQGPRAG